MRAQNKLLLSTPQPKNKLKLKYYLCPCKRDYCRTAYVQANILCLKSSDKVKMNLFKTYCKALNSANRRSNYNRASFHRLQLADKDSISILLKRPRWRSGPGIFVSARMNTPKAVLGLMMFNFILGQTFCTVPHAVCHSSRSTGMDSF